MKKLACIFLSTLVVSTAIAADAYICVPDHVTGFKFEGGEWKPSIFNTDNKKYIIRRSKESDLHGTAYPWIWGELGDERPVGICKETFSKIGVMNCLGLGTDLQISSKTLRFQETNTYGYVFDGFNDGDIPDSSNTPFIMIGKCSEI